MREVRAMTEAIGAQRGRPLLLSARIMARPEQNTAIGLDPVAWANDGLLDFVTVSHYLRNDYPLPIADYRRVLPEDLPIYASIEVEPTEARYMELADHLWKAGVDGIMVFNFFSTLERDQPQPFPVLAKIAAPGMARAFEPGTPVLLIVNKHGDTMSFVNPTTFEVLAEVPTGHDPHELVVTPDQRFAYISNYAPPGNTVSVIDLVNQKHVLQIPTEPYTRIHSAAMTHDGRFAYFTAGQSGYVVEIDTATNAVTRGIPTHGKISHMVILGSGDDRLYTANIESQSVSVIDRASGELIAQVPCEAGCEGMAFTPDAGELWVGNQNAGTITIIDPATNAVKETVPCPGMPLRIRFTPDGQRALISNWIAEGELVVMDAPARKEITRIRVGNQPIGVELSPDASTAFVTNMTSNEIHVIDMAALKVVHRFETGQGSDAMGWWTPPKG
jgi:YVTN family beta-propeller protein